MDTKSARQRILIKGLAPLGLSFLSRLNLFMRSAQTTLRDVSGISMTASNASALTVNGSGSRKKILFSSAQPEPRGIGALYYVEPTLNLTPYKETEYEHSNSGT
jgi:hypothetical protein